MNFDCCDCQWVMMGPTGVHCSMYDEEIINTKIAEECYEYKEY